MDQLDLLYRAFLDYRKHTVEDSSGRKLRRATARASADKDKVESQRSKCTVDEDWIIAIEDGLPFVEKAIMEDRQFIRQEGAVEPIEKVRHVSKDSVEHLARHGNLITRLPQNPTDGIIPDKLYIVEKLTNYAVYENRFLYMLLCYLRDFIDLRYNKIMELGNTYKADMVMTKTVSVGKRTIKYDTHFFEEARDDPYSKIDQKLGSVIERIKTMQMTITILLNTPLMREVSTAPMLKPPITRTNALRMDNALSQALALYDFIASYQKPGYQVEVIKKTYNPFPENMADEFSELVILASFLVYEYSNQLHGELKENYEAEERRRAEQAAEQLKHRIAELGARVRREGYSMEEYMLLLEERNSYLEPFVPALEEAKALILARDISIRDLQAEIERLGRIIANKDAEIALLCEEKEEMQRRHEEELEALQKAHAEALAEQAAAHEAAMQNLIQTYEARISDAEERHARQIEAEREAHEAEIARQRERHETELGLQRDTYEARLSEAAASHEAQLAEAASRYDETVGAFEARVTEQETALTQATELNEQLTRENGDYKSQLHGLRVMHGLKGDVEDYTSEERYEELIAELEALDRLIAQEWKKAKKKIRNEYLWRKP